MAVFRIERTRDYTVMSNHHLRNGKLSLKAKGLLSMMLSLPEDWNYTTRGLASICKEGTDSIGSALKELELNISDCDGILVTHEHSDHVKGLSTFLKKNTLPVYGAAATLDFLDANDIVPANCELNTLEGREEDIGCFGVQSFPTSHDVPCVGYRIHTPADKPMTIATDLGPLTPPVHEALSGCDPELCSEGLRVSLYNYMNGTGFDLPLHKWVGGMKVPRTTLPPNYIERIVEE